MAPRNPVLRDLPDRPDVSARLLAMHDRDPGFYPAFLDSAANAGPLGRFSLLLAAPGRRLELKRSGRLTGPGVDGRFCGRLNAWWRAERGAAPPEPWPFAGGWFLYLGYELAAEVEPTLDLPPSPLPLVASAIRVSAAIVHDHATGRTVALGEAGAERSLARLADDFAASAPAADDGWRLAE